MERLESRTSCSMPGREKDIAGSPQKWLGPEARAARERPPLRGNFHCFRTATLRHERLETFGSAGAGESEGYLRFYKHPAPLEPGRARDICGSTNIRLRWSRGERGISAVLQTSGSAGAGESEGYLRFYKHPAPLEPGRENDIAGSTNIRLPWSRGERGISAVLQTSGSAGAGER